MNAFTIAGFVGLGVILMGIILSGLMVWLSRLVTVQQIAVEKEQTAYNPAVTMGHKVPVNAGPEEQMVAARKEAARRAADTPRWGNMRIGRKGAETTKPASSALGDDPMTAVRIATFHTWSGARTGMPAGGVPEAGQAVAAAPVAAPSKKPEDLVPGKDYPFIEITDQMSPADVRNARIANVKARSEAIKALKETEAAAPAAVTAAVPATAPAVSIPKPVLIEITDSMSADEVRQARIANAKAESAYKKALKEAEAAPPVAAPTPAIAQPAAAPAVSIPEPDLIEITDGMSADEVRQARIANAKAQSAYKKALKEAEASQPAVPPAPAATAPAATPPPAAAPAGNGNEAALEAIPKPDLTEITDDMDPADVRSARINNAKALSAYKKALKEAGIDPASVDI